MNASIAFAEPKPLSDVDRLELVLSDGKWHSNFDLYRALYGDAPCGRLSARIYDLGRRRTVESQGDKEHGGDTPQRFWYRVVPASGCTGSFAVGGDRVQGGSVAANG